MKLDFIDTLSFDDCKAVHERVQARLSQMRAEDPMVYGVQRTYNGHTNYHTCVPGMGERQMLACDFNHSRLWLTSRRATAELAVKCFSKGDSWDGIWQVFEIPKTVATKLPCYTYESGPNYATKPEMVGAVK
jgi:hypothetical protein